MTLSKLAKLANVSVSVVSKAFSGREDVSEAMREHVFRVAREHGCFQQFYHAPYDKPVIAVIIPEAISQYYIHYIEALKQSMERNGYTMLLSISNFDRQLADELVRYYTIHSKVDGLLLIANAGELPQNITTAVVSFGTDSTRNVGASIAIDMQAGLQKALQHLKENGHSRVAYVGEPFTNAQQDGLKVALERFGMEIRPEWFITSHARFEDAGRDGVRHILAEKERPTAIFGAYGYITKGILTELSDMGLRVPQDMSVISMDSDPFPLDPSLDVTCILSDIEKRCETAMKLLNERIHSGHPNTPRHIVLPATFHSGNTVYCQN